jgi:hypothetical protein
MKVPVLSVDEFVLYLEELPEGTFIHCDVTAKWSKQVKSKLKIAFELLTTEYGKELYALHTPTDKKHEKFLKMFDFSYLSSIVGTDGNEYDIYIWR